MRSLLFLCVLLFGAAAPAAAGTTVVELFASQNCKSCPKAHETLKQASEERGDLLILTWSVDYWDYLGDSDPLAMPESKTRQSAYVERFKLRGPYTPQSVYNGELQCPGNKPQDVKNDLEKVTDMSGVNIEYDAGHLMISGDISSPADVWLVHFVPRLETDKAIVTNAVTAVTRLGEWQGATSLGYEINCEDGCAILVQDKDYGQIRGALRLH